MTEVTFDGEFSILIILHCPVRAGFHTFLAPGTKLLVDKHDPTLISGDCLNRARFPAGGIVAVVAVDGDKVGGFFNDPDESWPCIKPVFLFAGNLTGMAPIAIFLKEM
jgi:hypothetical protein